MSAKSGPFKTFAEMLSDMADRCPESTAILTTEYGEQVKITYNELYQRVMELASRYKREDCTCVGIYANASAMWIITMFAAVIAGKRTVLFDVLFPPERLIELVRVCGVDSLYATNSEGKQIFGGYMNDLRTEDIKEYGAIHEAMANRMSVNPDEEIEEGGKLLFFTSGTTDFYKAVVLSQQSLLYDAWVGQQIAHGTPEDTVLCMLPMWHVFGFVTGILWPLSIGAHVALSRGIRHALQDPITFEPDYIPVIPSLLKYMLSMDALNKNLGTIIIGGSPCDEATFEMLFKRGIRVMHGYGLTETSSGIACSTDPRNIYAMYPCEGSEFKIAKDGEIMVRTPSIMDGYFRDPGSTAAKVVDGWLMTGDLGHIDSEGRLIVLGKKDEVLVLSNGEKLFCPEIEGELNAMIGTETELYLEDDRLTLAVVARNKTREEIEKQVELFNKKQSVSKRIEKISVREKPLPRTVGGDLQRWRVSET